MNSRRTIPTPQRAPCAETLPHPLTFFLTVAERRRVLAALRRVHADRRVALTRLVRESVRNRPLTRRVRGDLSPRGSGRRKELR
jgi:hypothetical protein